ncbi:uncharacterized protein DUF4364 [Keratinibaculum paraultunense]|uniref:Uncharacterized protein DUF4364 n=1 Tax=Keratinibaculum paraultunense TaxID=1278232 RepID=A0A4V6NZ63_9FIRM|nr:DUF4364 family protein [Keratinibaculum paraultunense]QQY80352.1 DUF4364 family protein [Keratinibaculum paraultunense]TCS90876.1 uncharacterized protein DUF4364 [Keratinibaculum paraultunense]
MFAENTEELAQNKLLLLYIIDKSKEPLTNEELTEFILENNYMNYFLIQQYLSELVNSKFIEYVEKENKKIYRMLDKGKITLYYLQDRIPENIKKYILSKFNQISNEKNKSTQIIGEYFKTDEHSYTINLKLVEKNDTLFSLYLNVTTEEQAQKICSTWKQNTEYIFKNILNLLINEEIFSLDN